MASGSEKRTIPRREFSQPVHLKCTREKSGQIELIEKFSQGIDINSNGLGILTDFLLKKGDILKVTVPSKIEEALLPVFSRVVWAKKVNNQFRVGLRKLERRNRLDHRLRSLKLRISATGTSAPGTVIS